MAKKRSLWLYGCGLGCAVVGLVVAGLMGAGMLFFNRISTGFNQAVAAREQLDKQYGAPESFVPWPDGSIPAQRLEVFARVRETMAPAREAMADTFSRLPMNPDKVRELEQARGLEKLLKAMSVGKTAMELAPNLGQFFSARDEALLNAGMGMGEYSYLYSVVFHAWLGHPPGDGPGEEWTGEGARHRGKVRMHGPGTAWRVHDETLQMLRNQQAALGADAPAAWREALAKELAAMEKDDARLAWQEGVPASMSTALEPFRARLEASYNRTTNPFELSRTTRRGRFSYGAD